MFLQTPFSYSKTGQEYTASISACIAHQISNWLCAVDVNFITANTTGATQLSANDVPFELSEQVRRFGSGQKDQPESAKLFLPGRVAIPTK